MSIHLIKIFDSHQWSWHRTTNFYLELSYDRQKSMLMVSEAQQCWGTPTASVYLNLTLFLYLSLSARIWGKNYIVLHAGCSARIFVVLATICRFVSGRTLSSWMHQFCRSLASEWGKLIPFIGDFFGGSCSLMNGLV